MAENFVLKGNICYSQDSRTLICVEQGYLVCTDGISAGVYKELPQMYAGFPLTDYGDRLIVPGLTDLHLHAPQYSFRGLGMDLELLEWLNTRTFPEEAKYSDIILHVVDCSNPQMDMQMHTVYETLRQLDVKDKEIVTVFNKIDREGADVSCRDMKADYRVRISAKTGEGIPELLETFETILKNRRVYLEKVFPYSEAGRIQKIRAKGLLLSEEYGEDGIHVKAYVPAELFGELYK